MHRHRCRAWASAASTPSCWPPQGAKVVVNDFGGARDGTRRRRRAGPGGRRRDRGRRRRGGRQHRRRQLAGRRQGDGPARDRHLRRSRRARQQRRHPPRPDALLDDRGGVGRRHPGAPQGHLRAPAAIAAEHWRDRAKAGETNDARLINTTSVSGIYANPARPTTARPRPASPGSRRSPRRSSRAYGVTVNAIAPGALDPADRRPRAARRDAGAASAPRGWRR